MSNEVQPSLLHFEALVESATGGAIDVQIFAGGQLGNEVESGKQTQAGRTMQGTVMSSGAMSSFFSDYQIITSPFLFNDYLTARAYFDGEWHADFMKGAIATHHKNICIRFIKMLADEFRSHGIMRGQVQFICDVSGRQEFLNIRQNSSCFAPTGSWISYNEYVAQKTSLITPER